MSKPTTETPERIWLKLGREYHNGSQHSLTPWAGATEYALVPTGDSQPCVCCGKPSDTATEDGADMCWACMAGFTSAEYSGLKTRTVELVRMVYPHLTDEEQIDEILDPLRSLPPPLNYVVCRDTQELRDLADALEKNPAHLVKADGTAELMSCSNCTHIEKSEQATANIAARVISERDALKAALSDIASGGLWGDTDKDALTAIRSFAGKAVSPFNEVSK